MNALMRFFLRCGICAKIQEMKKVQSGGKDCLRCTECGADIVLEVLQNPCV
jgi:hypothetical protein